MIPSIKKLALSAGLIVVFAISPFTANAQEALSKADVEKIIGDYLRENPKVILESVENYRLQQEQEMEQAAADNIQDRMDFLAAADAPSIGKKDADVTVIEFFDYNCGYCKRALPDLQKLVKEDDNVRIVFHEMPILSPSSYEAAKWALAAHNQDKYFDYHAALMQHNGNKDEAALTKIAEDLKLDVAKMKEDVKSREIDDTIKKSMQVATEIGIRGTPGFIINGELYRGYLGPDGLKEAVKQAHGNKDG